MGAPPRHRIGRRELGRGMLALAAATMAGCAQDLTPRTVALRFLVEADVAINPNETGEPSPIVLRIYELKSITAFNQAQFFELLDNDTQKLGADLVAKREFELKPGDRQEYTRQTSLETRHIGVIGGFRVLESARWRVSTELNPDQGTNIVVTVTAQAVNVSTTQIRRFGVF
jgi:type VI secretion system protein VasD